MQYASDLTTVEAVIRQLEKADPGASVSAQSAQYNDFFALLKNDIIPMASAYIADHTHTSFVPFYEAREYYLQDLIQRGRIVRARNFVRLFLDAHLLVTSSITWNGTAISASYWREVSNVRQPYHAIDFDIQSVNLPITGAFDDSVIVTGFWGYHTNTSQMYSQVDASVTINSSSTSLTVTDAALYETLQYIKVESELMQITSRNETTEVLTVLRGVNGTTAAAHTSVAVSKFTPVHDIRQAATRLAAWAYQHRNDLADRIQFADGTAVITQMPAFVRDVLNSKVNFDIPARI